MKIAIATRDYTVLGGAAEQARHWLLYELDVPAAAGQRLPAPYRVELGADQLPQAFRWEGPHPLDGVGVILCAAASEAFIMRMRLRGAEVLLTGETVPERAASRILRGETQPAPRHDLTATWHRLQDILGWQ